MKKSKVLAHYKTPSAVAAALDITKQAVNDWGDIVPRGSAAELHVITRGRLKFEQKVYRKIREKRLAARGHNATRLQQATV